MNRETMTHATTSTGQRRDYVTAMKDQAGLVKEKYIDTSMSAVRGYVKGNPGKTLLISLAAGVLVGSLLRRR